MAVRIQRQCQTAASVTTALVDHPAVRRVNHPSRHTGLARRRADAYLSGAQAGLIGIDLATDHAGTARFVQALRLIAHVVNIGDTRSLVTFPAGTTHAQLTADERAESGISDTYVRLSIGLEDPNDLIDDLHQAFNAI